MQLCGHEQRKYGDAEISRNADYDQLFRPVPSGKPSEQDGERESYDLGDEKGDQKPGGVKPESRAVGSGHIYDGIYTVDIEKEGKKEQKGLLFFFYAPEG